MIHMGGEILVGYKGDYSEAFSEYGHKPWQDGYRDAKREERESENLYRFQAELAIKHGSKYTAINADFGSFHLREDGPEMMEGNREQLKQLRKKK
jgi:hypothetical protein